MQINLSPVRGLPGDLETALSVSGDVLMVDGVAYDLSSVPEGGAATPEGDHPFTGDITRTGGEITCSVMVKLGDDATPYQPADPAHWVVAVVDGAVTIPAERVPEPEVIPDPKSTVEEPQP